MFLRLASACPPERGGPLGRRTAVAPPATRLPSGADPAASLTAFNASNSPLTLTIMLTVVAVFVPTVLAYQVWVYKTFSHKVDPEQLTAGEVY